MRGYNGLLVLASSEVTRRPTQSQREDIAQKHQKHQSENWKRGPTKGCESMAYALSCHRFPFCLIVSRVTQNSSSTLSVSPYLHKLHLGDPRTSPPFSGLSFSISIAPSRLDSFNSHIIAAAPLLSAISQLEGNILFDIIY